GHARRASSAAQALIRKAIEPGPSAANAVTSVRADNSQRRRQNGTQRPGRLIANPAGPLSRLHQQWGKRAMIDRSSRRDFIKTAVSLTAAGSLNGQTAFAYAEPAAAARGATVSSLDSMLRSAANSGEVPGGVALAATDTGIFYEGNFGWRWLHDGPAMTRDTVFRIASMVKLITTIAALQLVEKDRLSLDARLPDIDPAFGSPKVLEGFDDNGVPRLRPAAGPITLRQLLTHTSGFTYRLWDSKAVRFARSIEHLSPEQRAAAARGTLMFDPGERWQYGTGLDWAGRIVEQVSGDSLDVYFRKHILDPLGMNDTAFVISAQQRQREASVHRRTPDG